MPSVWSNVVRGSVRVGVCRSRSARRTGSAARRGGGRSCWRASAGRSPRGRSASAGSRACRSARTPMLAELAAVEDLLEHAHRLVVAHVLVDREHLAGGRAPRRAARSPRRASAPAASAPGCALICGCFSAWRISAGCWSGGKARSTISTAGSSISASGRVVHLRDAPALGHLRRVGLGARGDRDDREARLLVGGEVALGHDHAGADAADGHIAAADRSVGTKPMGSAMSVSFDVGVSRQLAGPPE